MSRNILFGGDSYWTNFLETLGMKEDYTNVLLTIKATGEIFVEAFVQNGEARRITGLASRSFLIEFMDKMGMPVENHVLESHIEIKPNNIVTMTYVCAVDNRIADIDWTEIEIFREMR